MKMFICEECKSRGIETRWEHHHRESFCPSCGRPGTEVVEWMCTECAEEPKPFEAPRSPTPKCPECGLDCARVLYPFSIGKNTKFYERIDKAVADQKSTAPQNKFAARWMDAGQYENTKFGESRGNMEIIQRAPGIASRTVRTEHRN